VPSRAALLGKLCSSDEYGFWNVTSGGDAVAVPPFALSFSTKALDGHALAAGDEEGIVTVLDTRRNLRDQMRAPAHPRFTAHDNAIFDIVWLNEDRSIATASGDATVRVFDVETSTRRALLRGHAGSAKCVRPHPDHPHVLITAARDGHILGFDLRTPAVVESFQDPHHSPILKIAHPHTRSVRYSLTQSVGRKRRRVQVDGPCTSRVGSVTSLAFSPLNHAYLFSAGASDGALKQWDMRRLPCQSASSKSHSASASASDVPLALAVPGNELRRDKPYKSGRPHGIANVDVDPNGQRLLVSSTDSSIYLYNTGDIALGYEKVLTGHTQTSFYIRARFSPDGKFVLSGSADTKAFIWDINQRGSSGAVSPILELAGHRGGETSAVDWCKTDMYKVATCADDSTTKVWTLPDSRCLAREQDLDEDGLLMPTQSLCYARMPESRISATRKLAPVDRRHESSPVYREQDIRVFFSSRSGLRGSSIGSSRGSTPEPDPGVFERDVIDDEDDLPDADEGENEDIGEEGDSFLAELGVGLELSDVLEDCGGGEEMSML
jgi:WD40 repeat protein